MKVRQPPLVVAVLGGAGFIGANAAQRLLALGHRVAVLDDLSRVGSADNLAWLRGLGLTDFVRADVRDAESVRAFFRARPETDLILHLAGQVAMTRAFDEPAVDLAVNAAGTLNVLEAVRQTWTNGHPAPLVVYSSTNKVYGALEELAARPEATRYVVDAAGFVGVGESQPLVPDTPHAASKAAAEHYLLSYASCFGIPTVSFRQSCIYGPHQLGLEEQGWVAWLALRAAAGEPVRLFGDGRQVRDVLHVDDLVAAYLLAYEHRAELRGQALNVGGGPENTLSLLEHLALLEDLSGQRIERQALPWRARDQRVYVSDVRAAKALLGWSPTIAPRDGVAALWSWITGCEGPARAYGAAAARSA